MTDHTYMQRVGCFLSSLPGRGFSQSTKQNQVVLTADQRYSIVHISNTLRLKRCVWSMEPTSSVRYLSALSCILATRHWTSSGSESKGRSNCGDGDDSCQGWSDPLLRLRPVRLGTVTLHSRLLVLVLKEATGLEFRSPGWKYRSASIDVEACPTS